jgi:methyl-accepting chemotaxis protein
MELPKFPIEMGHPPSLSESHSEVCAHDDGTPGSTNSTGGEAHEGSEDVNHQFHEGKPAGVRQFLLVFLLAIWIVLLLRLIQIRRDLVPLAKLQQAKCRISLGQFQTRVTITSGDEFEELASFNSMAEQN